MDSGTCGKKGGQHTDDVTARRVLACLVPPELLEQQLVSAFAQHSGLGRHWVSEAAQQNLEQRARIQDRADSLRHFAAVRAPDNRGHQGISQAVFDYIRHYYHEHSKPSPSCKDQRSYWVCQTAGDDERTLVNETRRFFESSLLMMWLEFDDEQQHLEEQWRQNQHLQGGQLQQPPSMRVSLSTFVRLRPPWVARLTASQRQVCVCKTCCNLDNLLTAQAQHKCVSASARLSLRTCLHCKSRRLQLQPDADGSVMLTVRQYGKPPSAVGSRPVELLCMRVCLSNAIGMLNKQMPEYIKHHRLAHHQLQVFREHSEAVKAGKDGKVVISCDWSEKLTVERSVEIMSEHWHAPQIGILVACAYFKNKEGAYYEQTVYVMTDGKEQSAAITQAAVNQVVYYLLAEHDMDMRQLYMWSDGCSWATSVAAVSRGEARMSKTGMYLNVKI
ncbi:hypothetical protein QJQ45_003487 [Haematococcus lacustris]|nr:hypothetical protein QJQ45_003487 [Haematococcus lacustris]